MIAKSLSWIWRNIYNERYRKPLPLLEYIGQRVTDTREYFILIDEIQLLDRFEEVLNTLLKIHN